MLRAIFGFSKRPKLGNTQTDNLVYDRPFAYAPIDIKGIGGHAYIRSMAATYPMGITPGPTQKLVNPAVTGNINTTLETTALTDGKLKAV